MSRTSAERPPADATSPRSTIVVPPLENDPLWLDLVRITWDAFRDVVYLLFLLGGAGLLLGIVIAVAVFVVRMLT